jgi:hypothetical protein
MNVVTVPVVDGVELVEVPPPQLASSASDERAATNQSKEENEDGPRLALRIIDPP